MIPDQSPILHPIKLTVRGVSIKPDSPRTVRACFELGILADELQLKYFSNYQDN